MARAPVRLYWLIYGVIVLGIVAVLAVGAWYRWSVVPGLQQSFVAASTPRSSVGAVWMDHGWVEKNKTDGDIQELGKQLKDHGFTDAFFHVGPLEGDGSLPPARYAEAKKFLRILKKSYPELHAQAWIGQITTQWKGPLDLAQQTTKDHILTVSKALLEVGFDGIHLDIEPILDEDEEFLKLLSMLHDELRPRKKLLSVASDDVEPFLGGGFLVRSCCGEVTFWKPAYLAKVFGYVDQVAVMTYDSSLKDSLLYSWYVSLMTERLATLVPKGKTIFVGIPTFETGNPSFDPTVENITTGLRGVINGLGKVPAERLQGTLGVALYAYWETSAKEWETYGTYWLGKR